MRYSALKAFKYPDRIAGIKANEASSGKIAGPVHIQMILSDLCNQACHFCAYRDPTYTSSELFHVDGNYNPNRMLPFDKVLEILDDCAAMGVQAIQLTGGGEPTIYPKFNHVTEAIIERGMKWALVTNGVLHRRWDMSTASWIRVSLDCGTAETYSKIRQVPAGHFTKALDAIEHLKCGVGYVVTPENWHELYEAAKTVKALGASNMRIGAQFTTQGEDWFKGFRDEATEQGRLASALADDKFEVFNKFAEKMDDLNQGRPDYRRCSYQYYTTYIGADQNLYRCCLYAYNPRGLMGSVKDMRFIDAWRKIAAPDFKDFNATGCARCQYNRINRAINEVVDYDASEAFI